MRSSRPTGRTEVAAPRPWPTPSGRPPRRAPRTSNSCTRTTRRCATKIEAIATRIYGADGVEYQPAAAKSLKLYEELGFGHLPVCMAKTQYSLSHDANLKGRPKGFTLPIREVRLSAGAGFITPLCGEMRTMPGLPSKPGGENIDVDADGNIVGLF